MSLIDKISDLAIAIARDIKGLNTTVNSFDGRLTSTEGDVSGINDRVNVFDSRLTSTEGDVSGVNDRVTVLEGLHEDGGSNGGGGGLTMAQVREELSHWGIVRDEYAGEGWYKDEKGTVYCKGVPEGETHKFAGDPIEYVSVYTKEDAEEYGARAATSNITDMYNFFVGKRSFNEDISSWDVSNVTNMEKMLNTAMAFNQDISKWDVSNVTNMKNMLVMAESFNQDISPWDVSNVTDMESFLAFGEAFDQDLSGWCVSKITKEPEGFLHQTSIPFSKLPKWGTCPRGEDEA